jgi:hypothetical protein
MEALRQLDEFKRIQPSLPALDQTITLSVPMEAPLRDLQADELDVLQMVINWGNLQGVFDHAAQDDVAVGTVVMTLLERGYVRAA